MTRLSVNLNKVALMRNARGGGRPDLQKAAQLCIDAGAHGITLHPRPDGRHALASDVFEMNSWLPVELNVEGNPFAGSQETSGNRYPGFMEILRQTKPAQATLVPDSAHQKTSDHGWALTNEETDRLIPIVSELHDLGCRVSLFMDPDLAAIKRAAALGVDRIELYTESYARSFEQGDVENSLAGYADAARCAADLGLGVNAGHDLDLANLGPFLNAIPNVLEVSIGQALVSDALEFGLTNTVEQYLDVIAMAEESNNETKAAHTH